MTRKPARALLAVLLTLTAVLAACGTTGDQRVFGAQSVPFGQSLAVLGWNISVANLRFADDKVLIDVDAAPSDPSAPRADAREVRFGLYGALAHPVEATGLGSCDAVVGSDVNPLRTSADAFSGTVCLGPVSDQAQVRGVYVYSPRDRIAGSTVAYPAAFPLGLPRTPVSDSGLVLYSTSAEAWRADGTVLTPASLGDPVAFTGKGYLLLGLRAEAVAARYRDEAAERGGPLMIVIAPTLPAPGLNPACQAYGASVLIMPESSLDAVAVSASLCAQGDVNQAVLYPTVSIIGTHAGLWTRP